MKLAGQTIIITGGGRGFGEQMAMAAAAEGAQFLIADVDLDPAEKVAANIRDKGGKAIAAAADVANEDQVSAMVQACVDEFGSVDVLVNNAGIGGPMGLITEISGAQWDAVFAVNLKGYFHCAREAARVMIEKKRGHIINISSMTADKSRTMFRGLPYSVTKFGVEGLTHLLAIQLKDYNIRVNAMKPTLAITHFQEKTPPSFFEGRHHLPPEHVVPSFMHLLTETTETGLSLSCEEFYKP